MRPEIKEYNLDWMLWRTVAAASCLSDGSAKETELALRYAPYFRGVVGPLVDEGEPGILFLKLVGQYLENVVMARERGKKIAITTFCFSPALFYAMDVVPVTLELVTTLANLMHRRGTFDYLDYCCEVGFSETSCSSQRGALGAWLAGLGEEIDFVVCDSPGICDTNANAFAFASAYLDKPFYQLNYPQTLADARTADYHRNDYRELIRFVEQQTGGRLDPDRLQEIIEEINRQDDLLADLEAMQMLVPSPFPTLYNLFIYGGRFFFAGTPEYTRLLKVMIESLKGRVEAGKSGLSSGRERVRALMAYIDHYTLDFRFFDWLDRNGIAHMGCILSRFFADSSPYLTGREEAAYRMNADGLDNMIDSLADMNARMPMVRSIRGPYDAPHMWLDDTLSLAGLYQADCVIYNGTPGCRNTWGMVKPFARDLESRGYPTHIMYGDAFDERVESWEATEARLEEFFGVRGLL